MKKKALFITHSTGIYGASRSLQTFLKDYDDAEIHFIVQKKILQKVDYKNIQSFFHNKVKSINEFYLPFDLCYKGKGKFTFRNLIYFMLYNFNLRRFKNFIAAEKFDFIHLNSIVLHPLINSEYPMIIHVREIYDGSNEKVKFSLNKAKGVIFIDESTKLPFKNSNLKNSIVLNNPIDMSDVCKAKNTDDKLEKLIKGKTVFTIIGGIDDNKGVDFIIESFIKVDSPEILLMVVGNGHKEFIENCKNICNGDNRIIFWGEEKDIKKIYKISDFILRGEAYFCIGRTIFEGLYSGCNVVIPGEPSDSGKFFEFHNFKDKIFFYPPRNIIALTKLLEEQTKNKVLQRQCGGNLNYHLKSFNKFIDTIILNPN